MSETEEIERLKAENKRLREYADFKRDIKKWRNWVKIGLVAAPIIAVLVWDTWSNNSAERTERFFAHAHSGVISGMAIGGLIFVAIIRLNHLLTWWLKKRKARWK